MEEEILYSVKVEGVVNIENLTKANKELREERKKLDLETAEGQKRVKEINAALDANTNKIKENVSSLEKQRLNIGNYQSALDRVIPGFASFTQGIQGATTASKALIATPLGAILAAVAVVLGVVVAALKKSEPVLDFFENIITQITANIDFLLTNLDKLGSILYDLATFNISGAIDKVKGLTTEMIAVARAAQLYLDLLRELEDQQALFTVSSAKLENQYKALIVASKNRNLTFDEQKAKIEEALKIEKQLTDQRIDLARKEEVLNIKNLAKTKGLRQLDNETFDEFVNRILTSRKIKGQEFELDGKQKQQVADLSAARIKAESESLAFREKAANMLAAIDDKRTAAAEKAAAESEKEQAQRQKEIELLLKKAEAEDSALKIKEERLDAEIQLTTDFNSAILQADKSFQDRSIENKKKAADLSVKIESDKNKQLESLQNQALAFGFQIAGRSKSIQSGLTLISTYFSAQKAFESQFLPIPTPGSPIRGAIAAGIAIASGLARVLAINQVQGFAQGGLTGTKIMAHHGAPINRSNGDNRLVTVKTGEVILNERHQAALGGDATFARLGVPGFANSGFIASTARASESALSFNQMVEAFTQVPIFVTVEDINAGQSRVRNIVNRARVL